MYWLRMMPMRDRGCRDSWLIADGGGGAAVGDRADEVGIDRGLARQFHADLAAGLIDRPAADDAVGAREIDMLEDAEARLRRARRGGCDSTLPSSITTISPGSISRTKSAPMMSSAQVSDDSTQPSSPSRPSTSGRTPRGSRTPISLVRVMATTRERAFDPAQRVLDPFGDGLLDRPRHQVDDAFAVRRGLEDRAALDQLAPQGGGVGQVAVMRDGARRPSRIRRRRAARRGSRSRPWTRRWNSGHGRWRARRAACPSPSGLVKLSRT